MVVVVRIDPSLTSGEAVGGDGDDYGDGID